MMERFPFRFDAKFVPMLMAMGVHPGNSEVTLSDDRRFVAKFGRWRVDTPLDNIDCVEVSGPYRWYRAIGIRGSRVDNGITFGSSTTGGVCVTFHEPIRRLLKGLPDHPGLTVTVVEIDRLATELELRRGSNG